MSRNLVSTMSTSINTITINPNANKSLWNNLYGCKIMICYKENVDGSFEFKINDETFRIQKLVLCLKSSKEINMFFMYTEKFTSEELLDFGFDEEDVEKVKGKMVMKNLNLL